ncbi:MAG TPA: XrtA/PEP-CTERM system TPR-repeat protein PrsT [Rhizomicrobium sp.]|jgi:putative PEP-CTERM system TPR-repeat lipoprotein
MKLRPVQTRLALLAAASAASLICGAMPAVAALPPAGGGSSNAAVANLVSDAHKAIKAGKLPLAVIDLKNASSADPRNGPVRAELGAVLVQTGDYYSAERELRQARKDGAPDQMVLPSLFQTMLARNEEKVILDEFPEPVSASNIAPDILKARALAFLELNQPADAVDAMDKSLKLRRDVPGLILRARIAQKSGALPAALQFTDDAIAMAPNSMDAPLFKASLLLAAGRLNDAMTLADQTAAKFPKNLPVQFTRIEVLMRLNRNDQAKAAVDAILAKNPGIALGVYYRALLLARSGDNKNAWRIAQSLPQEFLHSQAGIAITVGQMAEASGNAETGAAILSAGIARFPRDADLRSRLAAMRIRQNDLNGALNALEPIKDTIDPVTAQTLAVIYVRLNRTSEALDVLEKLMQSGKGTDASTLQLVGLEERVGQHDQALKDLIAAVNQKPTDAVLASRLVNVLMARGRFADALAVADKLGGDPAQQATSLVLRGQVFMGQHKLDDALASYDKAMLASPKDQLVLYGRSNVLEQMQRYDDASKDVRAILALNPRNTAAYLKLAEIAARQNQDAQVRSALALAIQQVPQDPAPRIALARYLVGRRDRVGALNAVNDLLKAQPNNAEGVALLGSIQLAMGKKTEAVASFRRLVALTPRSAEAQLFLGSTLFVSGDKAGANSAMKSAVNLAPNSPEVRLSQINLLLVEKDNNGAVASAQAFQTANPGTQGDMLLGDTLARAGHGDQAMAVYKRSFSANPSNAILLRIARNSISSGDTKSAAEVLSNWVGKNPDDSVVRLEYATLLMRQANTSDAIGQFREILKRDPNSVATLNNLAWLMKDQDPKGATALATKAVTLAPNSPEALDTLGWLKLKHGKPADSLPLFKRAHDLRPQDGEISYHLALSLEATGSHDVARGFLKALLASKSKFDDLPEATRLAGTWH